MGVYKIEQRGRRVVLPATDDPGLGLEFSMWDAEKTLKSFIRVSGGERRRHLARVKVGLVHRSDNTYNPSAIAVVVPADHGGSVEERHLGFLYDADLREIGSSKLPALIRYAGGEVECDAVIVDRATLGLDLPDLAVLGNAIGKFLRSSGADPGASVMPEPVPERIGDRFRTRTILGTDETLDLLRASPEPGGAIAGVDISMAYPFESDSWTLNLHESATGRHLGTVQDTTLFLGNERDREAVLPHLAAQDVPVRQPKPAPRATVPGSWPTGQVPNVRPKWDRGAIALHAAGAPETHSMESFAIFNPETGVLWVEDQRLVDVASLCTSRLGLDVKRVRTPREPWELDEEVSHEDLWGTRRRGTSIDPWAKPALLAYQQRAVPRGILTRLVTFNGVADPAASQAAADARFAVHHRFVRGRRRIFPEHTLLGTSAPCRLCGAAALEFTTPISTGKLAYCHTCLRHATSGLGDDLDRAVKAVKVIIETEFDGDLFLEQQLAPLHINPAAPVAAELIDRALLLRFAIARGVFPWTHVLEATGLAKDGLRTSRGTLIRARDGHLCHSLREKAVCDFLHIRGISHTREPMYPSDVDYNPNGLRRADWALADGTLVELWGMPDDPAYAAKMVEKRELTARHGLRLVELLDRDLPNLPDIFAEWAPDGDDSGWEWSPLLLVSQQAQDAAAEKAVRARAAKKAAPDGTVRGVNAASVAARDERLERCRHALQLQAKGRTRATIAAELGVSSDAVKALLRDGRFYADPSTAPARRELADLAAKARNSGTTRTAFQEAHGLSPDRAKECWRDAGVLVPTDIDRQSSTGSKGDAGSG